MFQGALGWATYQYGLQCSKQSSKAVLFRYAALGTLPMRCDDSDPLGDEFGCRIVISNILLPNSAQAKPNLNFNLAELALFSENPGCFSIVWLTILQCDYAKINIFLILENPQNKFSRKIDENIILHILILISIPLAIIPAFTAI